MAKLPCLSNTFVIRSGVALIFFGCLLSVGVLTQAGAKAPPPGDDDPAPRKEKPKKNLFDDAEIDESKKPPRNGPPPIVDLKQAAKSESHPIVRELFRTLAVPHDMIRLDFRDEKKLPRQTDYARIKPLAKFFGDKKAFNEPVSFEEFDKDWNLLKAEQYAPRMVKSVQPYEQIAMAEVDLFMRRDLESGFPPLAPYKQAVAAEQALSAVLLFHESARTTGARAGPDWEPIHVALRKQLLGVLLKEVHELTKLREWENAFAITRRISEAYPDEVDVAGPLAELIKNSLEDPLADSSKRQEARQRLEILKDKFPNVPSVKAFVEELKTKAEALCKQAKALESKANATKDELSQAQELYAKALDTWPDLPGLRAYANQARLKYPVLRVGVKQWPRYMSPGLAYTDSERRVVEFLFESLVKFSPDASGQGRYRPGLAEGRPQVISLGRQFQLPANACWSNDAELTASDVSQTVKQLKKGHGNGMPLAWSDLFADKQPVSTDGTPHRVNIKLSQGYLEPLSLMTFKILPQPNIMEPILRRDISEGAPFGYDEKAFAQTPIGSGPFKFVTGNHSEGGRPYLSFIANVNYGSRTSKFGLPRFREVRLFEYHDAVEELTKNSRFLDLLLDLTAEEAVKIRDDKGPALGFRVPMPPAEPAPVNRRVYFLAINHRKPELQNADFRRALSLAVNREKLLDDCFRGGISSQLHKALNGPFPAGSWACNPDLPHGENRKSIDPFDPLLAKSLMTKYLTDQKGRPRELTLKYPANDPALEKAMTALVQQIESTLEGVRIKPEAVDLWTLRDQVEKMHTFDLAYCHYDFPDDTFWLWPLLGGDENCFGYNNGPTTELLRQAIRHQDFDEVKKRYRELHSLFASEVPLIPLWQLDPLLAIHKDVKTAPYDPHLLFTDIELWQLEGR